MTLKYDGTLIKLYRKRRVSTSRTDSDGNPISWTSQQEVADAVGVCRETVSKWEKNASNCSKPQELASFLERDPTDFLDRETVYLFKALKARFEEALLHGDTLEVARLSRQTLMWENFFKTGDFDILDPEEEAAEREQRMKIEADLAEIALGPLEEFPDV